TLGMLRPASAPATCGPGFSEQSQAAALRWTSWGGSSTPVSEAYATMRRKLLALVVLVALGVGAVAMSVGVLGAKPATASEYLTTPATVGDVTNDVAATGALASARTYGLVFGSSPYLATTNATAPTSTVTWPVTEVKVKPGDTVKKGLVLATAATTDVRRQLPRPTTDQRTANMQHTLAVGQWTDARDASSLPAKRQALLQVYDAQ